MNNTDVRDEWEPDDESPEQTAYYAHKAVNDALEHADALGIPQALVGMLTAASDTLKKASNGDYFT